MKVNLIPKQSWCALLANKLFTKSIYYIVETMQYYKYNKDFNIIKCEYNKERH